MIAAILAGLCLLLFFLCIALALDRLYQINCVREAEVRQVRAEKDALAAIAQNEACRFQIERLTERLNELTAQRSDCIRKAHLN